MNNLKIKKEEFDTTQSEISKTEALWGKKFPKEYVEFLLQYNGAITYPNWPNLDSENETEIWGVERFLSIGDVAIQKLCEMSYSLFYDVDEEEFQEHNLNVENTLVFAEGERGVYFFNLSSEEFGQIYIANFSGGDGISRTSCNSFSTFLHSLGLPDWDDEVIDVSFEFSTGYNPYMKVMQSYLFHTPDKPEIGFQRFKEVFEYTGDVQPQEDGYRSIIQVYVDDRLKLNYLIKQGCSTDGLLTMTKQARTIEYLVKTLNLDFNKKYKNRYPLQNCLSEGYCAQSAYEELHKLLETEIEIDWTIKGKLHNGEDDLPMIERLRILHEKYLDLQDKEKEFQRKYKKPSGRSHFIESKLIESKLGINQDNS